MTPEFSRVERLDTIGADARAVSVDADEAERIALARRFALPAVARLHGDFALRREGGGVAVTGRVTARVTQACSVTGEPLEAAIDEAVALRFVSPGGFDADEVELGEAAVDTIEIEGGGIDLGEVAAETMALALDPFPRSEGAAAALRDAGVLSEEQAGPFGALAALRGKLQDGA